jgi:hypothetical protein
MLRIAVSPQGYNLDSCEVDVGRKIAMLGQVVEARFRGKCHSRRTACNALDNRFTYRHMQIVVRAESQEGPFFPQPIRGVKLV